MDIDLHTSIGAAHKSAEATPSKPVMESLHDSCNFLKQAVTALAVSCGSKASAILETATANRPSPYQGEN